MGPFAFTIYFINDSALDKMFREFRTVGHWHLPTPNFELLPFRFASYIILSLMLLHAYTCVLLFMVYCDFSNRLLKCIKAVTHQIGASSITNQRVVNSMLTNVCKLYIEQKVLNLILWDMLQLFSLCHLTIIVPFLIIGVYICIRFSQLITWLLYIPSVLATCIIAMCAIFIHIYASCLHEQSSAFLESVQKNILPFKTRHPYWRMKFRSFGKITVGALGWHFSQASLLPMSSFVLASTINLLLL